MPNTNLDHVEFVTVIAASQELVTAQFKQQGLDAAGFMIVGPVAHHRITFVNDVGHLDTTGGDLFAATFRRARPAHADQQRQEETYAR